MTAVERAVLRALADLYAEAPRHWVTSWIEASVAGPDHPTRAKLVRILDSLGALGYAESGWPGAQRRTVWRITPDGLAKLAADAELPPSWVTS